MAQLIKNGAVAVDPWKTLELAAGETPETVALPAQTVRAIAAGHPVDVKAILAHFGAMPLISVRPSPENPDWGGPGTVLNIGMNAAQHDRLVKTNGREAADALYLRFVQATATSETPSSFATSTVGFSQTSAKSSSRDSSSLPIAQPSKTP